MHVGVVILLAAVISPFVGGLLTGIDRKISARMQGRVGPPVLQPFYDVLKLFNKRAVTVNDVTRYFVTIYLFFTAFTTVIFIAGFDILLSVFALTLANVFLVITAYSSMSPYSHAGAERELLQIMSYEPMVMLVAFGYYLIAGSFSLHAMFSRAQPLIVSLPLVFIGLMYVMAFKLRKSPFDLSASHHAHQELVKGVLTELNGICLAMIEIAHWYETIFALGLVFIFFTWAPGWSIAVGAGACLAAFFFEIWCDNAFARVKWEAAIKYSWLVTAAVGILNFYTIIYYRRLF